MVWSGLWLLFELQAMGESSRAESERIGSDGSKSETELD